MHLIHFCELNGLVLSISPIPVILIVQSCSYSEINPIELRKAKIVYNFGLSECNRIKKSSIW